MIKERIYRFFGIHKLSYQERLTRVILLIALCILGITAASAQEEGLGTEVVNIVKPYSPTVSDAFKIRQPAVLYDSTSSVRKPVKYEIFSVPVASTFTPARGSAATLEKPEPMVQYDNYASLGFGNYTSVLAELFTNFQLSRTENAGLLLRHHSSQGGIDQVQLDNKFYDTQLEGHYRTMQKEQSYSVEAGLGHQLFNWYGLSPLFQDLTPGEISSIDPAQQYYSLFLKGDLVFEEGSFNSARAGINYLSDDYGSSEFGLKVTPEFSFPLLDLTLDVAADLDFVGGRFEQGYFDNGQLTYSFLNAGIMPALGVRSGEFSFTLGVAAYVGMDLEKSDSDLYIYPRLKASYDVAGEEAIAYAGVDGGLRQNSYDSFRNENPFVSPTLVVKPTSELYNAYAGLKGKLGGVLGYNLKASYGKQEDRALFRLNPSIQGLTTANYRYGNSFGVVYDDINTFQASGEVRLELEGPFILGARATYASYNTSAEDEPWNLPAFQAALFSSFDITKELFGGVSLFYTGERKDLLAGGGPTIGTIARIQNVDGYLDANLELGYRFSQRLSVFIKGSNLVAGSYQRWLNFPVLGAQALLGATYKFDW